jgi:hypothetical protein
MAPLRDNLKPVTAFALAALLALALAACGGGGKGQSSSANASTHTSPSSPPAEIGLGPATGPVVVRAGGVSITRGQVDHWMDTIAGGDYYERSGGKTIPEGLVSDPPHYGRCVARLEAALAGKQSQPTGVKLLTKCQLVNHAIQAQATGLLVTIELALGLAKEEGIKVSYGEVVAANRASNSERFQTPAQAASSQAARRESISDELLLAKKNVAAAKLVEKLKAERDGAALLARSEARWTRKIDCSPGYVVERCKQFHGEAPPTPDSPSAAVLMEQLASLISGRCTSVAACEK